MTEKDIKLSRRQFVKTAGIAGVGAALIGCSKQEETEEIPKTVTPAQEAEETPKSTSTAQEVPKRDFGKTGEKVSILSLGGSDFRQNQLMLRQAVNLGATYWDTSEGYVQGGSELGIGMYFEKYPEDRKKVFLVTKAMSKDPKDLTQALTGSLERLKTSYVDLYFLHGIDNPNVLTPEVKQWAERAKADGKIRYFGFSVHTNVEDCLEAASRLDWIDGIMMTYNYQTMETDRVKAAVEACVKAGIGLTAMKTQRGMPAGGMPSPPPNMDTMSEEKREAMMARMMERMKEAENAPPDELAMEITERFRSKGFTMEQAKLQLVWENPHIACICSNMPNMTILLQNAAAATGQIRLTQKDRDLLRCYAAATKHQYCPGCTRHCESGSEQDLPIGVVMRSLMYARSYGDRDLGKTTFRSLPSEVRRALADRDYAEAERRCPNGLDIGRLMREASIELA